MIGINTIKTKVASFPFYLCLSLMDANILPFVGLHRALCKSKMYLQKPADGYSDILATKYKNLHLLAMGSFTKIVNYGCEWIIPPFSRVKSLSKQSCNNRVLKKTLEDLKSDEWSFWITKQLYSHSSFVQSLSSFPNWWSIAKNRIVVSRWPLLYRAGETQILGFLQKKLQIRQLMLNTEFLKVIFNFLRNILGLE